MENPIALRQPEMHIVPATVEFVDFAIYKERAHDIADFVSRVEVTPETVKSSKKLIAETRKMVDALSKERIRIKKQILASYDIFEAQVKELQKILDTADQTVRIQVKELEDKERGEKKAAIQALWDKRIVHYDFASLPDLFAKVCKTSWMNKSMSMNKVEKEMVSALEQIQSDFEAISGMEDAEEILTEYASTLHLAESIRSVRARKESKEQAKKILHETGEPEIVQATFLITGKDNIATTELLLRQFKIEYIKH